MAPFLPYLRSRMRLVLLTSLLTACAVTGPPADPALQAQPILDTMNAVRLQPMIAWVEQPFANLPADQTCPVHTIIDQTQDSLHELWTGGCALSDGRYVRGELERFDGPDGAWVVGRDFGVSDQHDLLFGLDGAIEITPTNDLWLVEVAATTCGSVNWGCDKGILGLDLSYTVYPAISFPSDYDATVSGTVVTELETTTLDGAWSVNQDICLEEPISGQLSIQQESHHAVQYNGEAHCDGCSEWQVQGRDVPRLCQ